MKIARIQLRHIIREEIAKILREDEYDRFSMLEPITPDDPLGASIDPSEHEWLQPEAEPEQEPGSIEAFTKYTYELFRDKIEKETQHARFEVPEGVTEYYLFAAQRLWKDSKTGFPVSTMTDEEWVDFNKYVVPALEKYYVYTLYRPLREYLKSVLEQ